LISGSFSPRFRTAFTVVSILLVAVAFWRLGLVSGLSLVLSFAFLARFLVSSPFSPSHFLMKMCQMALFGSASSVPFQRASRHCDPSGSSFPLVV
jgi:hypothetical protein